MKKTSTNKDTLIDQFAYQQNGVNFINQIISNEGKKISLTIKPYKEEFIDLDGKIYHSAKSDLYYGLNPSINTLKIIELIRKGLFLEKSLFISYIKSHPDDFLMHVDHHQFILPLYTKTLLRASYRYGFVFSFDDDTMKSQLNSIVLDLATKYVNEISYNEDSSTVTIHGCASMSLFDDLSNLGLMTNESMNNLVFEGSISVYDSIYKMNKKILLLNADVHYSGVLPRLRRIINFENAFDSKDIDQYALLVERTTFFTVDSLDHYEPDNHSYLNEFRDMIEMYYHTEENLIDVFYNSLRTNINKIDSLNSFLTKSLNTHIIGVTANLETNDGYLLIAERAKNAVDSGLIYPSVNGQSEFYDYSVDFYNNSVHEDVPTLIWTDNKRIDFIEELDRETYAELYIKKLMNEWEFIGLSVLGIRDKNRIISQRRFHFNVLSYNKTQDSLSNVSKNLKNATEKFESRKYYAVKITNYKNSFQYVRQKLWFYLKIIYKLKGAIAFVLSIMLLIPNILTIISDVSIDLINVLTNIFFSFIVALISLEDIKTLYEEYRQTKDIKTNIDMISTSNIGNDFVNSANTILNKLKKKSPKIGFHPMSYLMLYEYIMQKREGKK